MTAEQLTALDALIAAVEGDNRESFLRQSRRLSSMARDVGEYWNGPDAERAFHGSLDAAKALHDALLPERSCRITFGGEYGATVTFPPTWDSLHLSQSHIIPARAWLLAILRAYRATVQP